MMAYLKKFERALIGVLIVMLALVVLLSVLELGRVLIRDISTPPLFVLDIGQLLEVFSQFLLVLIGFELLETVKKYYTDGCVDVHVILSVALIALARKIITLEPKDYDALSLVGMAAIILSLVAGYWVVKGKTRSSAGHAKQQDCAADKQ